MTVEILILTVLACITILAYMVAINSHGPTRLSISYLLATVILAGTVWATVQHVNSGLDRRKTAELRKLEQEKMQAEERIRSQEETLLENRKRLGFAGKLNAAINEGSGLATAMMNTDLRDFSMDFNSLMGRASKTKEGTDQVAEQFSKLVAERTRDGHGYYEQSVSLVKEAIENLTEAGKYYYLYFRSEDGAQEELRERVMRQKARKAYEQFKSAGDLVASES